MKNIIKPFPVGASVLSEDALETVIKSEFFPGSPDVRCKLYYRSIHDTYIVRAGNREHFFKVYRFGSRTKSEIQAEIELLLVLKENGITATEPVVKTDGEFIIGFGVPEGTRYGVLFTSSGIKSANDVKETDEYNRKLGLYIGKIHKTWDEHGNTVDRWHLDTDIFIDRSMEYVRKYRRWHEFDLDFMEDVAGKTRERINVSFTKSSPGYGFCHGDFYSGNFRFDAQDNPELFDFDFCGYGWRMYDISVYLNAFGLGWDKSGEEKRKRRREAFLDGYRIMMPLDDSEFENMYLFIPFRRIFNIGTLYIAMANTWGDNWVRAAVDDDIQLLKQWVNVSGF